jgi:serine/threonine-protein kinase
MNLENGTIINQYKLISAIGKGGMGEVFLAEDTRLDRKVALKILPPEFAEDKERMSRFVREAKSASALNHPNIITIYEIGEADGTHFIATEYIEGETLHTNLKSQPLNLKSVLEITIQVVSALDVAHRAGIVHRDIKPENVMIRPDGLVKILDFGIAKLSAPSVVASGSSEDATAIKPHGTSPGMIIGTANYMSPEQAKGKEIDARSDIFSFGIVFYEMLTGKRAFDGETALESISSILKDEPQPISQILPDVPSEIERIVNKTLRKDRDERYQTAKDLLIDLKDGKQSLKLQNPPESTLSPEREEPKTQILPATTVDEKNQTATNQTVSTNPKTKYLFIGLLGLIVLVGGFFSYRYFTANKQIESIAVMPFVNESGNADVEYLSDGMTETLINSLSQIPNLSVKARSSVFRYKGKEIDPKKIASELNVQAILNGRVVQRGDQLTLSLELIDAQTENTLWGNKYERKSSELVALQSEVARDVSSKLKLKLSGADEAKVVKTYTANPEAYQLYLKGRFQWNKRTAESLKQAAEFYKQAIEKDPNYALAYSGLAETYVLFSVYSVASAKDSMPQAKAMALRGLEIDDSLAEAHTALGEYLIYYEWDRVGGEKEYRRAIELNPNYATAHQWLGFDVLVPIKRFDEATKELRRAEELDPLSSIIGVNLADTFLYARRYDEAIAQYQRVLSLDPNFQFVHINLGWAFHSKGMYREAIAEYRKALELSYDPLANGYLAFSLAKSGQRDAATKLLNQLKLESGERYVQSYVIAIVYIGLGEKDEALNWLEKDIAEHSAQAPFYAVAPELDDLRSEPRFKEMLKRMNLPE